MVCVEERTPPLAEGKKLVIVESPTKMKSIQGTSATATRCSARSGTSAISRARRTSRPTRRAFGKFSVDVENGFDPYYVVTERKKKTVAELKRALKDADELLLATDEDREGEAIAWHLLEVLKPKVPVHAHGVPRDHQGRDPRGRREHPRARPRARRRAGDPPHPRPPLRLGGLARCSGARSAAAGGRSRAGRVQSAATRLVVDRERERMAFVSASYWDVEALAVKAAESFAARLARVDGAPLARGTDFDDRGAAQEGRRRPRRGRGRDARRSDRGRRATASVIEARVEARHPQPARAVHHLDPAAGGRPQALDARQARDERRAALYENGYITYMRTDSPRCAAGDRRRRARRRRRSTARRPCR